MEERERIKNNKEIETSSSFSNFAYTEFMDDLLTKIETEEESDLTDKEWSDLLKKLNLDDQSESSSVVIAHFHGFIFIL